MDKRNNRNTEKILDKNCDIVQYNVKKRPANIIKIDDKMGEIILWQDGT
jgi:hypothetical protein